MRNVKIITVLSVFLMLTVGCGDMSIKKNNEAREGTIKVFSLEKNALVDVERVVKSEDEWKKQLGPESFIVARQKGTERAFTGPLNSEKSTGTFRCIGCGTDLFLSGTKFESGTGWPSFYAPVHANNIRLEGDRSFFMTRVEVLCGRCDAHLGHVFDDGPPPTGKRYCMNSASMEFVPGDGK